jgi:hypothetical protein
MFTVGSGESHQNLENPARIWRMPSESTRHLACLCKSMKKNLLNLPEEKLREIAANFSIEGSTKEEVAAKLVEYLRGYGLTWADLKARFELIS